MALFEIKEKEFDYSKKYDIVLACVGVHHFMEELPFNILLISSYLESKGYKVAMVVLSSEYDDKRHEVMKKLSKCCKYIGFTINDENYYSTIDSINYLHSIKYFNAILGGILVNYDYPYLRDHIELYHKTIIIKGEGCSLVHQFLSGSKNAETVDLQNVRFNRHLVFKDEVQHFYTDQNVLSFGCIHNACTMCSSATEGIPKHIPRNFEMVIEENEELARMGSERIHNICSCAYIDAHIPFYEMWNKNRHLRKVMHRGSGVLAKMENIYDYIKNYCYSIEYGVEAGSDHMLKVFNKSHDLNDIKEHMKVIRNYHSMLYRFYMIVGHPAETTKDVQANIELVKYITRVLDNQRFKFIAFPYYPHTHLIKPIKKYYGMNSYDLFDPPFEIGGYCSDLSEKHLAKIKEFYQYCDNKVGFPQGRAVKNRRIDFLERED